MDADRYTDKFGLISPYRSEREGEPAPDSGNGLLYTAWYLDAAWESLSFEERKKLIEATTACEMESGFFVRNPVKVNPGDQQGPDDLFGVMLLSAVTGLGFSKRMLQYGRECRATFFSSGSFWEQMLFRFLSLFNPNGIPYVYNLMSYAQEFRAKAWMGRFPHFVPTAIYSTGKMPPLLHRVMWCITIAFSSLRGNSDPGAWALNRTAVRAWIRSGVGGRLERIAVRLWRSRMLSVWGSEEYLLSRYFNDPLHPVVVAILTGGK